MSHYDDLVSNFDAAVAKGDTAEARGRFREVVARLAFAEGTRDGLASLLRNHFTAEGLGLKKSESSSGWPSSNG